VTRPASAWPLAVILGLALGGFYLATEQVAAPWVVAGPSMEPTLLHGDRVLVDRWSYRHRPPAAGEVVLVVGPGELPLVKRVVEPLPRALGSPERRWAVAGDNTAESADSRQFGALTTDRFLGRVVVRYWPPGRIGRLPSRDGPLAGDGVVNRRWN